MLSKFDGNVFYNSKIIFKVKERDTRLSHPWILLDEVYNVYFKINGSLTLFKFCHSTNKLIIHFKLLKYPSLLVRQRQNVVLTTHYHLINFLDKLNRLCFCVSNFVLVLFKLYELNSYQLSSCQLYLAYISRLQYTLSKNTCCFNFS